MDLAVGAMNLERDLGFDPDVLRAKYWQERDRRLRADGQDQYVVRSGILARFFGAVCWGRGRSLLDGLCNRTQLSSLLHNFRNRFHVAEDARVRAGAAD
jgi:hypothetical protein